MSTNWLEDIEKQDLKFKVAEAVQKMDAKTLGLFLDFRKKFLKEELTELEEATCPDDVIDALIDLVVVAIGTLTAFGVDAQDAWDRVLAANMAKDVGIKPGRPNPLGLPDLMKPEGWVAPTHQHNRSLLDFVFLDKWVDGFPEPGLQDQYLDIKAMSMEEAEAHARIHSKPYYTVVNPSAT